jgi:hypothetical protein
MENNQKVKVSNWRLRRMVPRALRVLNDHKGSVEELKAFEVTLVPAVQRFVELYDATRVSETPRTEVTDARKALRRLELGIRRWSGILTRDIPGFSSASFLDGDALSDDLIGGAERFLEVVRGFKGANGEAPAYVPDLLARISPLLEAATQSWDAAQTHMASERELLRQTREAAAIVHKELVALRRTVRATLGDTHRDYQMLRMSRVAQDEDEVAPTLESNTAETTTPERGAA